MMSKGPPELIPVIKAAEIPNQEFVSENPTPRTDQTEKFLLMSCVYPISASLRASASIEDFCDLSISGEITGDSSFSGGESMLLQLGR